MDIAEKLQRVEDLRQQVRDPDAPDPTYDEICEAVQALHQCRGAAQSKKVKETKVVDLKALFGDKK